MMFNDSSGRIAAAILPELSLNIIDRYLVASETLDIEPLLVLNKTDLLDDKARAFVDKQMDIYRNICSSLSKPSRAFSRLDLPTPD